MTETLLPTQVTLDAIQRYTGSDNPSAFLAVSEGNSHFSVPGLAGALVYRPTGRYLVQLGGPFAPPETAAELLTAFRALAAEQGRTVVGIQLQAADVDLYRGLGFTVNQVGASYAVELDTFSMRGTRFMQLRNKIARCRKAGVTVREAKLADWVEAMHAVDAVWLGSKGEHAHQLEYLVGQYGGPMQPHRRLFVATLGDELVGYISYSPVYGSRAGWMHDLSRRRPDELPGVMEAVNSFAIDTFRAEGVHWLHFGFTPFTGLSPELEPAGHSPGFSGLMGLLWEYGEEAYPAKTQLAYKQKWAPTVVLPEYVAFEGRASVAGFVHVFRAAGALD